MDVNATGDDLEALLFNPPPQDAISDVLEVIEQQSNMYNGGGEIPLSSAGPSTSSGHHIRKQAHVKIVEQPASKALRFRYECEGRSAGSIPGVSSTPENKTFPTIKIVGYTGRAVVVVSCVTKDAPYRPHPHSLVGREGCRRGVCTLEVSPETMTVIFSNLGIQCVKKKDIEQALKVREEIRVDPFRTGFAHRNQPTSIDLNAVRLCFQVFLEGDNGKFTVPLTAVVSDIIYDKKAMSDLVIVKLSDCVCPVDGGRKDVILLCEKVAKEDIQVRFYEEKDGQLVWEGYGDFQPSQVHKQTGIWFRPPRYKTLEVTEPVAVFIQLKRPSDGASSEPLRFEYLPLDSDYGKRKRQKFENDPTHMHVLRRLSEQERPQPQPQYNIMNIPMDTIKVEPRDTTPSPYQGPVFNQLYGPNMSPQYNVPLQPMGSSAQLVDVPFPVQFAQNQVDLSVVPSTSMQADDSANSINCLLNMDNGQFVSGTLNSKEWPRYIDSNVLLESFSNVSLNNGPTSQDQNMSDSLTRLANSTIEKMGPLE